MRLTFAIVLASAACSNRTATTKSSQCRIDYNRDWDAHEKLPTEHGLVQTYNSLSHDLYHQRNGGSNFELWPEYLEYCHPCVRQLPSQVSNNDLFPANMALPLKVIDCFYFVDANNREWHSPIEAKLSVEIIRDPSRQGPPADQVLEWPPRERVQ